jgi:predicted Rossmann-fold nucleotide-binding protein
MLDAAIKKGFMSEACRNLMFVSSDPQEIIDYFANYKPFEYDKYGFLSQEEKYAKN